MSGEPFPKSAQLARGQKRYRRKVASNKRWQQLQDEKIGPCRICTDPGTNGSVHGKIQLHHIVPRDQGGDDVAENLVPLCPDCHGKVTRLDASFIVALELSLTPEERAYALAKRSRRGR